MKFEEKLRNRITEEESKKLVTENNHFKIQNLETTNQLETYKNLFDSLSRKNKNDEMRIVKVESEVEKYYEIVKQLQSISDVNAQLGKKVY